MKTFSRFVFKEWAIGYMHHPIDAISLQNRICEKEVTWLVNPRNMYRADPFGVVLNNSYYMIYELFDYSTMTANIACGELTESGLINESILFDHKNMHVSYPFLIYDTENDAICCIPEMKQNKCLAIYQATDFPFGWKTRNIALHGLPIVDPTIIWYKEKFWLFCTLGNDCEFSKLYVFYTDSLSRDWQPHKANPVKTDWKSSRPGGTPFIKNGELFRIAQDCSQSYGSGITITKVLDLDENVFSEVIVNTLKPNTNSIYAKGLHTLSQFGTHTLIDGRRDIISIKWFLYKLKAYLIRKRLSYA